MLGGSVVWCAQVGYMNTGGVCKREFRFPRLNRKKFRIRWVHFPAELELNGSWC